MSNNPLPFGFRPEMGGFSPDPQNSPYAPAGYPGGPTAPGFPGDPAALSYPGGPPPGYAGGSGYLGGAAALSYSGGPSAPGYSHGPTASGYSSGPIVSENVSGRTTFENSRAGTDASRHNMNVPPYMNAPVSQTSYMKGPYMNSPGSQPHNMNSPGSQTHNMNSPISQPPYMNAPVSQPPYMNAPVSQPTMNSQTPPRYPNLQSFGSAPNSGVTSMHVQHTYTPNLQTVNTQFLPGPTWIKWHKGQLIPSNAVQGGTDVDNAKIYVGRVYHKGDLLPAKVMPEKNVAYISYNGEEIDYYECEVLCQRNVRWIASSNGNVPPGAIQVGQTQSRESLYAGRVHHKGSVCVGKVHPSHGVCYIPFGGEEKAHRNYEVLVA